MMLINILFGSSCVGKSTIMERASCQNYKVEMDHAKYWEFEEKLWPDICFNFLIKHIERNKRSKQNNITKNMIVTCGGLPDPTHPLYEKIEKTHNVVFRHTLVLTKSEKQYLKQIKKRKRMDVIETLMEHYRWREGTQNLYHEVFINDGK